MQPYLGGDLLAFEPELISQHFPHGGLQCADDRAENGPSQSQPDLELTILPRRKNLQQDEEIEAADAYSKITV